MGGKPFVHRGRPESCFLCGKPTGGISFSLHALGMIVGWICGSHPIGEIAAWRRDARGAGFRIGFRLNLEPNE